MDKKTFDSYKNNILRKAATVRSAKEAEYLSESDSLANFRKIASFRGNSTPVTIMNLGAKSIQSISDMINTEFGSSSILNDEIIPLEEWDEKFVDAINYLLKLYASIREEME